MFELKESVAAVHDSDSLCELLRALDWPVAQEFAFDERPEIAREVKGAHCKVYNLVPSSTEDERLFLLVEFEEPYVRRDLREVLASLRRYTRDTARWQGKTGTGDTIFVVASPGYEDVRFVLFEEQERRLPRIRSFGWRREFIGRTVLTHNLERLRWDARSSWQKAWDVDSLTEQFYEDYRAAFEAVYAEVQGTEDPKLKHSWTQLLFNRLLFLAFIQRMGWLRMPRGSRDGFLFDLYRATDRGDFSTLYGMLRAVFAELDRRDDDPLKNRFASTIGQVPYLNGGLFDQDDPLDRPDITVPDEALGSLLAEPQGLFARYNFTVTESTPLDQEVAVDPEMLGKIFERLIIAEERHQTGTYYTPRPIVEFMVNEALKGYLIDRGLAPDKAALLVDQDKVESDELSFKPSEMQDALDWLFEVRAVDPACGSGAYLLMLLQRLFELVDRLEISRDKGRNIDQKHLYETKLQLLERCIYGVDLNETAVRIARLRMWLSLVVENKGEKPDPLPNFDFLIMQGDALASPLFPAQNVLGYPHEDVREYTRLKRRYFHPKPGQNRPTRAAMNAQRAKVSAAFEDELSSSRLRSLSPLPFDWEVEFGEVFDPQDSEETVGGVLNLGPAGSRNGQSQLAARVFRPAGFDIVVANPPYVNSGELLQSVGEPYKKALVESYKVAGSGTADLLVFFLERAMQLLRPNGVFAYITSNKWLKAAYGKKLRAHLAKDAAVSDLIDFHDGKVFQNVICYSLITIAKKSREKTATVYTSLPRPERDSTDPELLDFRGRFGHTLSSDSLGANGEWSLETGEGAEWLLKMRSHRKTLRTAVPGRHAGLMTGLNDVQVSPSGQQFAKGEAAPPGSRRQGVFVINPQEKQRITADDPLSKSLIKPLAIGRDIRKWWISSKADNRFIIYLPWDTDIDEYPGVKAHLSKFRKLLESRSEASRGIHPWFAVQRPRSEYARAFEEEKIVYQEIGGTFGFALSPPGQYVNNKVFLLRSNSRFLLGVLNSSAVEKFVRSIGVSMVGDAIAMQNPTVEQIPIPEASLPDEQAIEEIVETVLLTKSLDPQANVASYESELNDRVEFLYFHRGERGARKNEAGEEVPYPDTYDEWLALLDAEKGTAAEEVRKILEGDESGTVEFKETLEYVDRIPATLQENRRAEWKANKQKECVEGVLRTICGFHNSKGGTLLIGVDDRKGIIGLAPDFSMLGQKQNRDGFENKLKELLKRIRPLPTDLEIDFPEVDSKTICRVVVAPSPSPHYLDNRLFVRFGNSSEELTGRDLQDWLEKRGVSTPS